MFNKIFKLGIGHTMGHFSKQEVRAPDWADLKLVRIEVNKQIS